MKTIVLLENNLGEYHYQYNLECVKTNEVMHGEGNFISNGAAFGDFASCGNLGSHAAHPDAVVDHRLRVKRIQNLRQIDAGIMPVVQSANTNPATNMAAERGAIAVKCHWLCRKQREFKEEN